MNKIERKAVRWLFGHDKGTSSEAMCGFFLTGQVLSWSAPGDPSDFGRCLRFLDAVPEWRKRVPELKAIGGEWPALARNWTRLEALYRLEAPTGRCPKLWAEMQRLRRPRATHTKGSTR